MRKLYTSESVTEGHPDKICDQISDAVLDEIVRRDPYARVACETCVSTDFVLVTGEITTTAEVDIEKIARDTIREIGYVYDEYGFNGDTCEVQVRVHRQSPDIAQGVDRALDNCQEACCVRQDTVSGSGEEKKKTDGIEIRMDGEAGSTDREELGAGDQGMMFGYATNETEEYMPAALVYANRITSQLAKLRKHGHLGYLGPDGKAQVTVAYNEDGEPEEVTAVVVSAQHEPDVSIQQLRNDLKGVIFCTIPRQLLKNTKIYVNPTGRFVVGGPCGDSGLTGRKIIADTYGGYARHGGGAFSGKDCTKVDRSAAYYARYAAKNIVAAGLAGRCEVQVFKRLEWRSRWLSVWRLSVRRLFRKRE